MYGFHIGMLEVFTRLGSTDTRRWSLAGEQGNFWANQRVTIDALRSDEHVCTQHILQASQQILRFSQILYQCWPAVAQCQANANGCWIINMDLYLKECRNEQTNTIG